MANEKIGAENICSAESALVKWSSGQVVKFVGAASGRLGRHNQSFFPRRPETTKDNPEQLVHCRKPGTAAPSLEHCKLLTQGEVFNHYSLARSKQAKEDAEPKPHKVEHGSNS
jgi:hypothetical protein